MMKSFPTLTDAPELKTYNESEEMKKTINKYEFIRNLLDDNYANWTVDGAAALFDYLEELEDSTGTEIEFDRVALRCDYAQWKSLEEFAQDYLGDEWRGIVKPPDGEADDEAIREWIREQGVVIEFDGGIIVSSF